MKNKIHELQEMVDIMSFALIREKSSIEYYKNAYDKSTTETARRLFSLLVEQEKGHEAKLRAHLHEFKSALELEKLKLKK